MYRRLLVLLVLVLISACEGVKKPAPLLPLEDFFRNPEKVMFRISPDGKHISWLAHWQNRLNIYVKSLDDNNTVRITSVSDSDVKKYYWVNNSKIVFNPDKAGNETFHLHTARTDGSLVEDITPVENVNGYIIDLLDDEPNQIMIAMNNRIKSHFDVYKLNINSGKYKLELANNSGFTGYLTDHNGVIRLAYSANGLNTGIHYRRSDDSKFELKKLLSFTEDFIPVYFDQNNKYVYVKSNINRDKIAVVKYDFEEMKEVEEVYSNPVVDVSDLVISKKMKQPVGVTYYTSKKGSYIFVTKVEAILNRLGEKLRGYEFDVIDFNDDENMLIVKSYNDKTNGSYYLYSTTTNLLTKLSDVTPWLDPEYMAEMKPVTYLARDSLKINAYLTIPKGRTIKNLPLIVYPHGGPVLRTKWEFNPVVQFFANRGYVVLQPNYRGSAGYGVNFIEKGFKQWGGKMQEDIADGAKWLIEEGIVDSNRVAIYGFSFGGYSALISSAAQNNPYKCAVCYGGIANLFTFLNSIPPYWEPFRKMMYETVGNPVKDSLMLAKYSPVYQLGNINIPMLIAHGSNDPRASKDDMDYFVAKLKKRNIPVEYIVKENEGHSFSNEENRLDYFRKVESFFAKHLRGRKSIIDN